MSSKIVENGSVTLSAEDGDASKMSARLELLAMLRRAEQRCKDGVPVGRICDLIIDEVRDVALLSAISNRTQERSRQLPMPFVLKPQE
jgi:hypothetical protein